MARKMTGLGRGLDALFADAAPIDEEEFIREEARDKIKRASSSDDEVKQTDVRNTKSTDDSEDDENRIIYVNINDIKPNHDQPRKKFNEDKLRELAQSIEENGVIQPLVVRRDKVGYELVAGERRWRASRLAGLKKVPCIVRSFDEKQNMIVAIIENMQREDLDPIEEALGIHAMTQRFNFTQEQVAGSLGKSRVYITNALRLLKLPEWIQEHISEGRISAAHGRTIINVDDKDKQKEICEKIIKDNLSVRATEKLAEKAKDEIKPERKKRARKTAKKSQEIRTVEDELRTIIGTKVNIEGDGKVGRIELEYYSMEELNRLIDILRELR